MRRPVASLRSYAIFVRRLPRATGLILAARSPVGRSIKIFLFGVGAILPLGSLIWALLFWHGHGIRRYSRDWRACAPRRMSVKRA
jgi:hypothetical protein